MTDLPLPSVIICFEESVLTVGILLKPFQGVGCKFLKNQKSICLSCRLFKIEQQMGVRSERVLEKMAS